MENRCACCGAVVQEGTAICADCLKSPDQRNRDRKKWHVCAMCRWYEMREGYCHEKELYRHGYDGTDCERWKKGGKAR